MRVKIALAGNPNCGKTSMFNELTGSNQYVGNWPGVTVEKKEGRLKTDKDVIIQDLPGIYSLSPYTPEEVVARNYIIGDKPDAIINIIDATNLERNLYLTEQLVEIGIPVVIALNMIDIVRKNGDKIDTEKLGKALGCKVFETSALKGEGEQELVAYAVKIASEAGNVKNPSVFRGSVEHAIAHIEESLEAKVPERYLRWYAVKVFERDKAVLEELDLEESVWEHINKHIKDCEAELDDDAESIITIERYDCVEKIASSCIKRAHAISSTTSDKIDYIVTNRFLALPIFALVMFLVYYISISTLGSWASEWVGNTLFKTIISQGLSTWFSGMNVAVWLSGLVINGIVAGVGAVLGFLPQMLLLFLLLSILEDIGYMSRIAFIMDKIFRRFGLSGKSFIPLLIGTGCSVPGIMASRTIENERDRRMTIITTSFIPCGAKMPFVALIAGVLFGGSAWIAASAYFVGVAAVVISGIILKKTKPFAGNEAPFVMELPPYHAPLGKNVFKATWERVSSFVRKAGTIILASSVILWFLQAFGISGGRFISVSDNDLSLLASFGKAIAPIFTPLGFGFWQAALATITGLLAKESIVATFGILFGFTSAAGGKYLPDITQNFTALSAYCFMIFNLLCAPCFAAMSTIKHEMKSGRWTLAALSYQCGLAYVVSMIINQVGRLFSGGTFGVSSFVTLVLLAALVYLVFRKNPYENSSTKQVS